MWQSSVLPDRSCVAVSPGRSCVAVLVDDDSAERVEAASQLADRFGAHATLHPVRPCGEAGNDPYALACLLPRLDADAVILVAPRRRGSRRLLPGPTVCGVPVGIVQLDHGSHLRPVGGQPDPAAPWVVAAMAKNVFLSATEDWATRLDAVHGTVDLRADRARRDDLLDGLAAGPGVVMYAGHGSPRGWAGYQALRIEHLANSDGSAGLVIAFACNTLARQRRRWPFGSALVEAGAAQAYLAPATAVLTADAERLAEIVVEILVGASPEHRPEHRPEHCPEHRLRVGDLMRLIDRRVEHDTAARRAWATFRLVGGPSTSIV